MIRLNLLLLVSFVAVASANEPLPRIPPKEPDEALKTLVVRDGFEMQLIAAEMRDYPYTDKASDKPFTERMTDQPLGRVRLLEDTDGDGRFDKSTIYAEGLSWPTGLALWKGGSSATSAIRFSTSSCRASIWSTTRIGRHDRRCRTWPRLATRCRCFASARRSRGGC